MSNVAQANASLSQEELDLLSAVLDVLIPPSEDGRFPGAGALGCGFAVAARCATVPGLLDLLRSGLHELERASVLRYGSPFQELELATREHLVSEQSFVFPVLVQTYIAYYQHPAVLRALGLEARPPHPEGHRMNDARVPDRSKP